MHFSWKGLTVNSFKDYSTYLPTVAATESNYKAVRSTYLPTYLPTYEDEAKLSYYC